MPEPILFDVFLSHSNKDKAAVRKVAERLRKDGLRVWFDEWEIKPGASIPAKIEEGLEQSRVLVLCMSANAFGSDWARLEAGTFRFRDPLNKERRFIPLRFDGAEIKGSLAQFLYVAWRAKGAYEKLLEACRLAVNSNSNIEQIAESKASTIMRLPTSKMVLAFDVKRNLVASGSTCSHVIDLYDLATGHSDSLS